MSLLAVLGAMLIASWFFATHDRVTETRYVGFHGEARYNPFLAAEMLLDDLGIEADSIAGLSPDRWMPDNVDTVVTRLHPSISVGAQAEALRQWVSEGGHLVLLPPESPVEADDVLLSGFGLTLREAETADGDDAADAERPGEADEDYAYSIDLDNTDWRIEPIGQQALSATLSDSSGYVAVRRNWDDGYVTVLAADHYFDNDHLEDSDHARLLLDTVAGYIEPGKVWFVYGAAFPSLGSVLLEYLPYLLACFAVALAFWIWAIVPAFGPPIRTAAADRRSLIEHVRAAGRFAWHHDGIDGLGRAAVATTLHRAEARHPGISRLPATRQAQRLAHITGLPEQRILDALVSPGTPQHREFIDNLRTLHTIREML